MAETTPPSSPAETAEATPPPPWVVDTVDTEMQTEREDSDSPERKRKKTRAVATEVEILRDYSGDSINASLEISDDGDEDIEVGDSSGVSFSSSDGQDNPANAPGADSSYKLTEKDQEEIWQLLRDLKGS